MTKLLFIVHVVLLSLVHLNAYCAPPLEVNDELFAAKIDGHAEVLEDKDGLVSIDDILSGKHDDYFYTPKSNLQFGFTSSTYWIRIKVKNKLNDNAQFVLNITYPLLDDIQLFFPTAEGIETIEAGDKFVFNHREHKLRSFMFLLPFEENAAKNLYLRVVSTSTITLPMSLYTMPAFIEELHDDQAIVGAFYGLAIGLFLYNLFLYISIREITYFFYLGVVVTNIYIASCFDGFNYKLFQDSTYLQSIAIYVGCTLNAIFSGQFSRVYLATKVDCPKADILLKVVIATSAIAFIGVVTWPGKETFFAINIIIILTIITIISTAMVQYRNGYKPAKLFLLAWGVMLSPVFIGVLNSINIISLHAITPYIHKIGVSGELIILSLALADRINILKQAEHQAIRQVERAQAETKAKGEFLAKMSHEIRTPMNGVLGMSELLNTTPLRPDQVHYVRTIHNSGEALLGIINDILDHSKIESGKLEIEELEFNYEELLDECISVFSLRSSEKKLPVNLIFPPDIPRWIASDPTRVRQVIINLLGNAFKFTDHGEIQVAVERVYQSHDEIMLKTSIIDTGIGITEEQKANLFQDYVQADKSTSRKFGGTGLGLSICKQLTHLMGGEIGVEGKPSKGTTFWFTSLCKTSNRPVDSKTQAMLDTLHGKNLLVVDDHDTFRMTIKTMAEYWGMRVYSASDPIEALDIVSECVSQNIQIDCGLLDLEMPEFSGVELSKKLDAIPNAKLFPHILITAARQLPDESVFKGSSIKISCEKPIASSQLKSILAKAINGSYTENQPLSEKHRVTQQFSQFKVLIAEDNNVNQLVLSGMLKKLGITFDIVENGLQAVEKYRADFADYDAIFMDCEMPELDGFGATQKIRDLEQKELNRHCPIIALTAHAMKEHIDKAMEYGMDQHLPKPVSLDMITHTMENIALKRH